MCATCVLQFKLFVLTFVLAGGYRYVVCSVIKNHSTAAAVFSHIDKLQ